MVVFFINWNIIILKPKKMEFKAQGRITQIMQPQSGTTSSGTTWTKMTFVIDSGEEYNNIFAFEIWKNEKVLAFQQFNKIGDEVEVLFNVDANEYKGKYYTNLKAWKVTTLNNVNNVDVNADAIEDIPSGLKNEEEDLPF